MPKVGNHLLLENNLDDFFKSKMYFMKLLRYVFVAISMLMLVSFVGEEAARSSEGLQRGNTAPEIALSDLSVQFNLKNFSEQYVLVNFWAAYDAGSRAANVSLWNELKKMDTKDVAMVSVSFDDYQSVFEETIKIDGINSVGQYYEPKGENSTLFEKYHLKKGFTNYLLDKSGRIVAKNVNAENLERILFMN